MPWDLLIRNGQVVTRDGAHRLDLAIEDGKIVDIAAEIRGSAREEIDAAGLHVFPGVIDPHVHFNEPGRTDWEGWATGSAALAAGGGTTCFEMPLNANPPTLDGPSFDLKRAAAEASSLVDFGLWGGLTPDNLDTMDELADRGVIGFKAFMCPSGIDEFRHADLDTLQKGMEIAAKRGLVVAVHAEEPGMLDQSISKVAGADWQAYLASRPMLAEDIAARLAVTAAELAGCGLHIVHVSHPHVLSGIVYARERGSNVTCETCPHYLLLCDDDLRSIGARAKCSPPLRSCQDMWGMQSHLLHDIDFVVSDHSPAPESMKVGDDAFAIWGGIAGVQSTLPALITLYHESNRDYEQRKSNHERLRGELAVVNIPLGDYETLTLERIAKLTATNVAERFGIANKGEIARGFDADLALVDLDATYTLTRDMLLDRHKLSPYVGRQFRGLVKRTIRRGETIFLDGKMVGTSRGRLIKPRGEK
jgi:allantoinase